MTQQYLRKVTLKIGNDTEALDLSGLHIKFMVRNGTVQTLKYADIRVYNLAESTSQKIHGEFTTVELSAGYEGNSALIFQGEIIQCERGKENATDTFLHLIAQDGDKAYNWAVSNWTLAKGYSPNDVYKQLLQDLSQHGISAGYKPTFSGNASVDAFPCYGMTREHLRNFAEGQGCAWSIENNKLNFIPIAGVLPGQVPVLSPASGLIGMPSQTIGGINVTCLLNPMIRAGCQVQIKDEYISTLVLRRPLSAAQAGDVVAGKGVGGYYKAVQVTQEGDTRGNAFYTRMICVAVDGTAPNNPGLLLEIPEV